LTTILGLFFALRLPGILGVSRSWGVAGLTASAGIAGWVEFLLLRRSLHQRIGAVPSASVFFLKLWVTAAISAAAAWGVKIAIGHRGPLVTASAVLIPYGLVYFGIASMFRIPEAKTLMRRLRLG
jgi:putative peptidoglycan lipid II flippase